MREWQIERLLSESEVSTVAMNTVIVDTPLTHISSLVRLVYGW